MSTTSHKPIDEWNLDGVLKELEKFHSTMDDRQFAFILGAGASVASGIPAGHALAKQWLEEIYQRECLDKELDLHDWLDSDLSDWKEKNIKPEEAGSHYPTIFERRFKGDREAGYAALETVMEGKFPSIGYSLLACIIHHTRHKVVITTNFDNLVADALSMQAHQSPLIVAHESLAGFVRPKMRRPLIAKIHRDLFLNPINDENGVSKLEESWKIALKKLFQYFTPIVIGYGGNDGSLMNMLQDLNNDEISGRMFWCYRGDKNNIPIKVLEVLSKHNGILVKIPSFDELMIQLAQKLVPNLSVDEIPNSLKALAVKRAEHYQEQLEKLAKETTLDKETASALKDSVSRGRSWWAWQLKANEEQDILKRDAIYQDGIKEFPTSGELSCNYANFLTNIRHDHDKAEEFYKKAIELNPFDAESFGNYALFLEKVRKNYDASEEFYKKSIELNSIDAGYLGNYALFLEGARKNYDAANDLYKRAIELDPANTNNINNYATYLMEIRKDFSSAETYFKRALSLDPTDQNILANYTSLILIKNYSKSAKLATKQTIKVIQLSNSTINQTLAEALLYGSIAFELFPTEGSHHMLPGLKYLLTQYFPRHNWSFENLFSYLLPNLPEHRQTFYHALGDAILNEEKVSALEKFSEWKELQPIDPFSIIDK